MLLATVIATAYNNEKGGVRLRWKFRRLEGSNKMKAIVSITIDDEFVLHDIKVVDGEKGLFIAMPSKKTADGEFRDIAHPIKTETRNRIQKMILDRYLQEQELTVENDESN